MIHYFPTPILQITIPQKFTYPFHYTPHPLCILASEEVKAYIATQSDWHNELESGKMFGVLVIRTAQNQIGYLAAFSGNLAGSNRHEFFVPPIYDLLQPQGFFKTEEKQISTINARIKSLETDKMYHRLKEKLAEEHTLTTQILCKAKEDIKTAKARREIRRRELILSEIEIEEMIKESQFQKAELKRMEKVRKRITDELATEIASFETEIQQLKAERKQRSASLQQRLFEQFSILNAYGEKKDLYKIFEQTNHKTPPSGAGECALPKLLQYAYLNNLQPLAMAEFWWGNSPKTEIRHHGYYYPSCKSKCEPILEFMLQGLKVDDNPLSANIHQDTELEIVFEDEWLVVVNKPAGMLSVPGKAEQVDSVYKRLQALYPTVGRLMLVHRLDMATSGLLLAAKTKEVHQHLQAQFKNRSVKKRYIALLDGILPNGEGTIDLPICPNHFDRPRQIIDEKHGKPAITYYQVLGHTDNKTRIAFYPLTGRTHQLRVHAAHPLGLHIPITGDELYGRKADRLYLHAECIEFKHPISGEVIRIQKDSDF